MFIGTAFLNSITFFSKLDTLYTEIVGQRCGAADGNCLVAYKTFGDLCSATIEQDIRKLFTDIPDLVYTIKENRDVLPFYHQGFILYLMYLLKRHRNRLIRDWPLDRELLQRVATNIGVSLDN
jgi:hypothetical protein